MLLSIFFLPPCILFCWQMVFYSFLCKYMWHDQGQWVGCREYWFWVTGLKRWQILMFYIVFELHRIVHISTTRCPIEMGFGWKCGILIELVIYIEKWKLNIANMWLIPLDRVTYLFLGILDFQTSVCIRYVFSFDLSLSTWYFKLHARYIVTSCFMCIKMHDVIIIMFPMTLKWISISPSKLWKNRKMLFQHRSELSF